MKFPPKIHWHPFTVHFPGVFYPFSGFMLILFLVYENNDLEIIATYSLLAGALTNVAAIVSGFVDWKKKYRANLVPVFIQKIGLGLLTLEISSLCLSWRYFQPDVVTSNPALATADVYKYLYIGLVFSLSPAIGQAGHLGGKLIHT